MLTEHLQMIIRRRRKLDRRLRGAGFDRRDLGSHEEEVIFRLLLRDMPLRRKIPLHRMIVIEMFFKQIQKNRHMR